MKNNENNQLSVDDQKKVDAFLRSGVNEIERSSFRPLKLALALLVIVIILGVVARMVGTLFLPY